MEVVAKTERHKRQRAKWNVELTPAVAKRFDAFAAEAWGSKREAITAAVMMLLSASPDERNRWCHAARSALAKPNEGREYEAFLEELDVRKEAEQWPARAAEQRAGTNDERGSAPEAPPRREKDAG